MLLTPRGTHCPRRACSADGSGSGPRSPAWELRLGSGFRGSLRGSVSEALESTQWTARCVGTTNCPGEPLQAKRRINIEYAVCKRRLLNVQLEVGTVVEVEQEQDNIIILMVCLNLY